MLTAVRKFGGYDWMDTLLAYCMAIKCLAVKGFMADRPPPRMLGQHQICTSFSERNLAQKCAGGSVIVRDVGQWTRVGRNKGKDGIVDGTSEWSGARTLDWVVTGSVLSTRLLAGF